MKYSRTGQYLCSTRCWPCRYTFLFILATSVFHVTAAISTTTAAIKYNNQQQQTKQLEPQTGRQQRQQLYQQHNQQQSTRKNNKSQHKDNYYEHENVNVNVNVNENDTAETISGTILQSAMGIIDDNFDFNNNKYVNNNNNNNNNNNKHKKSEKSYAYSRHAKNRTSNEKSTEFPKAKPKVKAKAKAKVATPTTAASIEVISPTMINIRTTNAGNVETMKLSTAITPTYISATDTATTVTPTTTTTTTVTITTTPTTTTTTTGEEQATSVLKIVAETATTTAMSRTTDAEKLLSPIAMVYDVMKMSDLKAATKIQEQEIKAVTETKTETAPDEDDNKDNNMTRSRREILSEKSSLLMYQQQTYSTSTQKAQQQQQQQQQQLQQTTSLENLTPLNVVAYRGTTPSTLLRLMSEEHEHYASSLYAPPFKRERRQEPLANEPVDKCRTFSESDDNKQVINSPDYPNDYPKNINCTRVIVAPKGQIIRLDFRNSFHIEDKEECKFDYLEIRDGQYGFSNLIGKYCGTDFPPEITSKERYLWLHFHSDESIEYSGFTAVYEFIDRSRETPSTDLNCTIEKSGVEGFVNSTDIPEDIRKISEESKIPLDCMWRIRVNETWKIQIKFLEFKLVRPNDCEGNFLDIFPEETTMPLRIKNFCGSAGEGIASETNVLHIRFYAEHDTINSTFGILYTAFRERGAAPSCAEGELDCQDSTCISDTLMCNERDNCKFRWDEEPCKKNKKQDSSEILIIIVVFGLILGGMILTFLVNCIRKIMRDQKIIRSVPAHTDGIYHIDSFVLGAPKAAIFVGLQNDYVPDYEVDENSIWQQWHNCRDAYEEKAKQLHHDHQDYQSNAGSAYSHDFSNSSSSNNSNSPADSNSKSSLSKESSNCGSNIHDSALANVDEESLEAETDENEKATVYEARTAAAEMDKKPNFEEGKASIFAIDLAVNGPQNGVEVDVQAETDANAGAEIYTSDESDLQNFDNFCCNALASNTCVDAIEDNEKYCYKNHGYYGNNDEFVFVNNFYNDRFSLGMTKRYTLTAAPIVEERCECNKVAECEYMYCCMPQTGHQLYGHTNGRCIDMDACSPKAICDNSNSSLQTFIAESAATIPSSTNTSTATSSSSPSSQSQSQSSSSSSSKSISSLSTSTLSCATIALTHIPYGAYDENCLMGIERKDSYAIPTPPPPPIMSLPFLNQQQPSTSSILCGTGPRKANRISPMPEDVNNYRYPLCFIPNCPSA